MTEEGDLAPARESWTRLDAYLASLARRRTARRSRTPGPRTEPEAPRLLLSTLPFLALIAGLAVLSVAIAIAAWPVRPPVAAPARPPVHELGTAPKGWFQKAQKEFR
jgi:hypothetical protein